MLMNSNEILFRNILNLKFLHVFLFKPFCRTKISFTFGVRNLKNIK